MLNTFPDGIPCRSYLIPDEIKNLQSVNDRKSQVLIDICQEDCPDSSGIKLMKGSEEALKKMLEAKNYFFYEKYINKKEGEQLIMSCGYGYIIIYFAFHFVLLISLIPLSFLTGSLQTMANSIDGQIRAHYIQSISRRNTTLLIRLAHFTCISQLKEELQLI